MVDWVVLVVIFSKNFIVHTEVMVVIHGVKNGKPELLTRLILTNECVFLFQMVN